jgi:hypothetical protein
VATARAPKRFDRGAVGLVGRTGRLMWAVDDTGLGVGATRWSAQVALDLLDGGESEATRLRGRCRSRVSVVFGVVRLTAIVSRRPTGARGLWLGALDRLGLGFES